MTVVFDPEKNRSNRKKHGIALSEARFFDLTTAYTTVDEREDYGEIRLRAVGFLKANLYTLIFTYRDGHLRPISLRKATNEESIDYGEYLRKH